MRIAHLIPTLAGGGAERQLAYLTRELARRGHDVRVGYVAEGMGTWPNDAVPATRIPSRSPYDPRLVTRTLSLLRSWNAEIVQTWIVQMDVVGGLAAALLRIPWVLREPTTGSFYAKGWKPRLRLQIARAAKPAVVANSEGGLAYWRSKAPKIDARLIRNGLPVDEIDGTEPMALPPRTGVFLGRLESMKNIDIALAAVARVSGAQLVICGDGPDRTRLERIVGELAIADRVRFTGWISDAWRYLKGAAFFVSLSDFEGSPNTVAEAFAARVPAILSDIPAHRAMADASMAALVPLRDVEATARAIACVIPSAVEGCRAAGDGSTTLAMTQRAYARIEPLSIAAMADAYEQVYRDVLARRHR